MSHVHTYSIELGESILPERILSGCSHLRLWRALIWVVTWRHRTWHTRGGFEMPSWEWPFTMFLFTGCFVLSFCPKGYPNERRRWCASIAPSLIVYHFRHQCSAQSAALSPSEFHIAGRHRADDDSCFERHATCRRGEMSGTLRNITLPPSPRS